MRKKSAQRRTVIFCAVMILVLAAMIGGLQFLESAVFHAGDLQIDAETKTITRFGREYFPRQDITVMLFMGIDAQGPVESSGSHFNEGRADAVMLAVLDHTEETWTLLALNRDSMVRMPVLGINGKPAGTYYGQLALSHTYGEGLEDSCENTRNTVSSLLYGITIDHYVAMNMDAIVIVNDAVGGVTVNVTDDFSKVDPSITRGEVTLMGKQAWNYIRARKSVGNQLNLARMDRQQEYMHGLMEQLKQKEDASGTFMLDLYEDVSPYMVTDCSAKAISGLMQRCSDYELKEVITPEGRNIRGEDYYEFYIDEDKLDDLILRLFYAPK